MSDEIFYRINDAFDCLPLAAIVDDKIFCCHGGLGPKLMAGGLKAIEEIKRPYQSSYRNSLVNELLWADPATD